MKAVEQYVHVVLFFLPGESCPLKIYELFCFCPQLTHGILMKELSHLKDEETLQCNDSVKIKTKEYIRSYMKKFGPVYKRS